MKLLRKIVCEYCYVRKRIKECHTYCFSYQQGLELMQQAKKEVFDDIDEVKAKDSSVITMSLINGLRERHLSTFKKKAT